MSVVNKLNDIISFIELSSNVCSEHYDENINSILIDNNIDCNYPYSLKCFIKWVHFIEHKSTVIDIDFDKIEMYLKYHYRLYHTNKLNDLRQIYYNFEVDKYDTSFETETKMEKSNLDNKKLFAGEHSIVHYILHNLCPSNWNNIINYKIKNENDALKSLTQSIMIIRLLIKENIVSVENAFEFGHHGLTIHEKIKDELFEIEKIISDENKYKTKFIDMYFDLYLFSIKSRKPMINDMYRGDAIIQLNISKDGYWLYKNICHNDFGMRHINYNFNDFMPNNGSNLIQRLLFRGISPFAIFFEKGIMLDQDNAYDVYLQCEEMTEAFLCTTFSDTLLSKIDVTMWSEFNRKVVLTAPLMVLQFLKETKNKMFNIISKYLRNEFANIVILYLFVGDEKYFFGKDMLETNKLDIKTYEFFNYIGQVPMNENRLFHKIFDEKYDNLEFAKHVMDKHSNQLLSAFCLQTEANIKYLYKLIVMYPPLLKDYYYFLFAFIREVSWRRTEGEDIEYIIKFLAHLTSVYPATFDVNYSWESNEDDPNNTYEIRMDDINNILYH
eukprot:391896_1